MEEAAQVPVIGGDQAEPQVVSELHIRVYDNGGLELFIPEEMKQMSPEEIESLTQIVHKQMYEQRIVKLALDTFKQRLSI